VKAQAALVVLGLVAFFTSRLLDPLYRAEPQILLDGASVALPPGFFGLALTTLLGFALLLSVETLAYRRFLGLEGAAAFREVLASYAPLAFLLPFAVLFFPGVPLPMIGWWLVLEGRAWLATLVLGLCLYRKASFVSERRDVERTRSPRLRSRGALFTFAVVLLGLLVLRAPDRRFTQPYDERWGTGDEPRYVRITASLLHDGDADVGNAAEQVGRRVDASELLGGLSGFGGATLRTTAEAIDALRGTAPAGTARSLGGGVIEGRKGGTFYSFLPGLPFLLVPSMALDSILAPERLYVTLFTCLLASVVAFVLLVPLVEPFIGSRGGAFALALALALSLPSFFYHFQVYTEVPAAICLTVIASVLLSPSLRFRAALAFGLACALLPWLHSKYLPFWGVAGLAFLFRAWQSRWDRGKTVLALFLPALAFSLNCLYVFHITGSLLPDSLWVIRGYGRGATLMSGSTVPGLYYLLLDRAEGLLVYGPLYLFVLPGLVLLYRQSRFAATLVVAFALPYLLAAASHDQGGAGGWSPPSRYLVPLVPLFALALGAWLRPRRSATPRWTALLVAAAGSFWIAQGMRVERNFPYDRPAFLGSLVVDPSPALGSVVEPEPILRRAAYPLFLLIVLGSFGLMERREAASQPARMALAIPILILTGGALVSLWTPSSSWIHPRSTWGETRLRAGSPRSLLLPLCPEGRPAKLRLRSAGREASAGVLSGAGLEKSLDVPAGITSELPVEVAPIVRYTAKGRVAHSIVTITVGYGEPPIDADATCPGS
jgi:hypothetical protein